jgi:hypothetical protein
MKLAPSLFSDKVRDAVHLVKARYSWQVLLVIGADAPLPDSAIGARALVVAVAVG